MPAKKDRQALVIFDNPEAWDRIEEGCGNIFSEIGDPDFSFSASEVPLHDPDDLSPEPFDLVILWIKNGSSFDAQTVQWLDRWAESKSSFSGGTFACFIEDDDPRGAFRFWKMLTESVAAWPGIDFHWQRLWTDRLSSEIVSMMANELRRGGFHSGSGDCKEFQLHKIEPCYSECR